MTSDMISILAEPISAAKVPLLSKQRVDQPVPGVFFVGRPGRFMHRLRCGERFWSFPITVRRKGYVYPIGFNAHQVCTQCGVERFFDLKNIRAGRPFYRSR